MLGLFNRKGRDKEPELKTPHEIETSVEIVAHKDAKREIVEKANEVSQNLNDLLVKNGFIVKIVLAAKSPQKPTNSKGGK